MFETGRSKQQLGEDFLKHAAADSEAGVDLPLSRLADSLGLAPEAQFTLLSQLEAEGCLHSAESGWQLTENGWARGRELLRAHRLYESYLAETTGMSPGEWHAQAEQLEHTLDREQVDQISESLHRPRYDPHGDVIPTRSFEMAELSGCLLSQVSEEGYYRILHLEDEPREPFERILSAGLGTDLVVKVEVMSAGRYHLQWAGRSAVLDSAQAAACLMQPCEASELNDLPAGDLAQLAIGEEALVHSIASSVRGLQRRRLLDLGFVPGSRVVKEGVAAFNGPMRFRVRGTAQALRPDLAAFIYTKKMEAGK